MKKSFSLLLAALCGLASAMTLRAQTTAFTYQGRLNQNSAPAQGIFDLRFAIYDVANGGSPVSSSITYSAVGVTNGLFTVQLDFGANVFSGQDRWLDVAVRAADNGNFSPLTPRQPITPTPYAVTALNVPGISGSALHSANDGPLNVVVVDNFGKVGVGTTTPVSQLHVASKANELPPRLQSTGSKDFSAGWDFYHGGVPKGYVGVPDQSAPIAPGELVLFGAPFTKVSLWPGQNRALTANTLGNIGIGTDVPSAKLEVRGDIKLGPNGQYRATSSEENLRIVRGLIGLDGRVIRGAGFQVTRDAGRRYTITFDTPFTGNPVVTSSLSARANTDGTFVTGYVLVENALAGSVDFLFYEEGYDQPVSRDFHFIAIGPR